MDRALFHSVAVFCSMLQETSSLLHSGCVCVCVREREVDISHESTAVTSKVLRLHTHNVKQHFCLKMKEMLKSAFRLHLLISIRFVLVQHKKP